MAVGKMTKANECKVSSWPCHLGRHEHSEPGQPPAITVGPPSQRWQAGGGFPSFPPCQCLVGESLAVVCVWLVGETVLMFVLSGLSPFAGVPSPFCCPCPVRCHQVRRPTAGFWEALCVACTVFPRECRGTPVREVPGRCPG